MRDTTHVRGRSSFSFSLTNNLAASTYCNDVNPLRIIAQMLVPPSLSVSSVVSIDKKILAKVA